MTPKASVIILSYNNTRLSMQMTRACIRNIVAYTNREDYELILIDPIPNKGNHFDIGEQYWQPVLDKHLKPQPDPGYAECCNIGGREASHDYLVFIQNDAFVQEGWLEGIMKYLTNGYDLIWPDQTARLRDYVLETYKRDWFEDASLHGNRDEGMFAVTKKAWEKIGGYDKDLSLLVQKEFLDRMFKVGIKWADINKVRYTHIMAGSNMQLIDMNSEEYEKKMTHDAILLKERGL